ncbi:hypothetical protein HDU93_001898, partial [Gonapodya sp. JEL0774]
MESKFRMRWLEKRVSYKISAAMNLNLQQLISTLVVSMEGVNYGDIGIDDDLDIDFLSPFLNAGLSEPMEQARVGPAEYSQYGSWQPLGPPLPAASTQESGEGGEQSIYSTRSPGWQEVVVVDQPESPYDNGEQDMSSSESGSSTSDAEYSYYTGASVPRASFQQGRPLPLDSEPSLSPNSPPYVSTRRRVYDLRSPEHLQPAQSSRSQHSRRHRRYPATEPTYGLLLGGVPVPLGVMNEGEIRRMAEMEDGLRGDDQGLVRRGMRDEFRDGGGLESSRSGVNPDSEPTPSTAIARAATAGPISGVTLSEDDDDKDDTESNPPSIPISGVPVTIATVMSDPPNVQSLRSLAFEQSLESSVASERDIVSNNSLLSPIFSRSPRRRLEIRESNPTVSTSIGTLVDVSAPPPRLPSVRSPTVMSPSSPPSTTASGYNLPHEARPHLNSGFPSASDLLSPPDPTSETSGTRPPPRGLTAMGRNPDVANTEPQSPLRSLDRYTVTTFRPHFRRTFHPYLSVLPHIPRDEPDFSTVTSGIRRPSSRNSYRAPPALLRRLFAQGGAQLYHRLRPLLDPNGNGLVDRFDDPSELARLRNSLPPVGVARRVSALTDRLRFLSAGAASEALLASHDLAPLMSCFETPGVLMDANGRLLVEFGDVEGMVEDVVAGVLEEKEEGGR